MKKMLVVICLPALLALAALAQDGPVLRKSLVEGSVKDVETVQSPVVPTGCSPCLWYSGDFNPTSALADGLFNANSPTLSASGQVWVPFTPTSDGNVLHKHVAITSITFNEQTVSAPTDLNGGTFEFDTMVSAGSARAGKPTACKTVTASATGRNLGGYVEYSYTCKLKAALKLLVGTNYWVNLLPTFTAGNYAYLSDVEDMPAHNQMGWGNTYYNSYFDSGYFSASFTPTWGSNAYCNGVGCDEFSVAIGGTYVP